MENIDALSGVRPLEELMERIRQGWEKAAEAAERDKLC